MKIEKPVLALYTLGIMITIRGLTVITTDLGPGTVLTGIFILIGSFVLHKKSK